MFSKMFYAGILVLFCLVSIVFTTFLIYSAYSQLYSELECYEVEVEDIYIEQKKLCIKESNNSKLYISPVIKDKVGNRILENVKHKDKVKLYLNDKLFFKIEKDGFRIMSRLDIFKANSQEYFVIFIIICLCVFIVIKLYKVLKVF